MHEPLTEESAKAKLEELGFTVKRVEDMDFLGWSIEPNGDGWGVWELHRTKGTFDRIASSLSGLMPSPEACAEWLHGYMDRGFTDDRS